MNIDQLVTKAKPKLLDERLAVCSLKNSFLVLVLYEPILLERSSFFRQLIDDEKFIINTTQDHMTHIIIEILYAPDYLIKSEIQ